MHRNQFTFESLIDFIKEDVIRFISILLFIIFPLVLFLVFNISFVKRVAYFNLNKEVVDYEPNSFKGKSFVTSTYPALKDVIMVGDSYASFVACDLGFDLTNFSCSGFRLDMLKDTFDSALKNPKKYYVVFIGPNDFMAKTEPTKFGELLSGYAKKIRNEVDGTVILTTYMPSAYTRLLENQNEGYYPISEYNNEILKIIDESNKIYYLDISSLDNYDKYRRTQDGDGDFIHFNKEFNIAYINKLYDLIIKIKKDEIANQE